MSRCLARCDENGRAPGGGRASARAGLQPCIGTAVCSVPVKPGGHFRDRLPTRRSLLAALGGAAFAFRPPLEAAPAKPLRGIFIIMATPYTEAGEVDFEDLAREVDFLDCCGVHGMVWPQLASEYYKLSKEERFRGMELLARAAKGKKAALVLGVQGPGIPAALEYTRYAEKLGPDALIAIPPTEAKSIGDFRDYYRAIAQEIKRPIFVQTTGGAKGIEPKIELLVALAREFPQLGYIKEEHNPVTERMKQLAAHRPAVQGIFSGGGGRGMIYEWRLGMDGTMPGAPYSDVYVEIWDAWQAGRHDKAREIFSKLLLMLNCDQQIPGTRLYIMKKRGVFKTWRSRTRDFDPSPAAIAEIEFHWAGVKPYLRV
jgi:dihydrodipicolinate synthase/N-acetylneuraminate lyase